MLIYFYPAATHQAFWLEVLVVLSYDLAPDDVHEHVSGVLILGDDKVQSMAEVDGGNARGAHEDGLSTVPQQEHLRGREVTIIAGSP